MGTKPRKKSPGRKPLPPLTPRPRNGGPWDWTKRYWKAGDRVTIFNPKGRDGVEAGTPGTVQEARQNRFGRVSYLLKLNGVEATVPLMLEELLDNPYWTGPPTTLLYTGRAASRIRKTQEKECRT
jgi:hypothetical protein